ncbi:hypothetical protein [Rhizobium herbae]
MEIAELGAFFHYLHVLVTGRGHSSAIRSNSKISSVKVQENMGTTRAYQTFRVALTIATCLTVGHVNAGELELAEAPGFQEHFSGNSKVSGQFLSGLAFNSTESKLDLNTFKLSYSGPDGSPTVCVRLTSEDGRYWAANLYRAKGDITAPPTVPVKTSYEEQLGTYGPAALLVLATFAENCQNTSGGLYVPGIFGTRSESASLMAYVNVSQSRVQATLEAKNGTKTAAVTCKKPAGGAKVTYSHICQIPADALAAGRYRLKISVKGLTGTPVEQDYAVLVN